MLCPFCHGADVVVEGRMARCRSLRVFLDPMKPLTGPPPAVECGEWFAIDGGDAATCSCGLYPIGRCPRCNTPFCAEHHGARGGQRLCPACAGKVDEATRREQAAHEAENRRQAQERAVARERSDRELSAQITELLRRAGTLGFPHAFRVKAGYQRSALRRAFVPRMRCYAVGNITERVDLPYDGSDYRLVTVVLAEDGTYRSTNGHYYGPLHLGPPMAPETAWLMEAVRVLTGIVG